jgi:hypothetical protein
MMFKIREISLKFLLYGTSYHLIRYLISNVSKNLLPPFSSRRLTYRRASPLQCHHSAKTSETTKFTALNIRGLFHYSNAIYKPCACWPNESADDFDVWQNVGRMGTETEVPCHTQASCAVTVSSCTGSSCHTADIGMIHWILIPSFYLLFAAVTLQMVWEVHLAICSITRYLNLKN